MKSNLSSMTQIKKQRAKDAKIASKAAKHAKLRASQGAAQAGVMNVPDGVGHVDQGDEAPLLPINLEPLPDINAMETIDFPLDVSPADPLHSDHAAPIMGHDTAPEMAQKASTMTLTLKSLNAKGTQALYTGAHSVIRIAVGNFAGKIAPATLDNFD